MSTDIAPETYVPASTVRAIAMGTLHEMLIQILCENRVTFYAFTVKDTVRQKSMKFQPMWRPERRGGGCAFDIGKDFDGSEELPVLSIRLTKRH